MFGRSSDSTSKLNEIFIIFPFVLSRWFHGKISREDATGLLTPERAGAFLVREIGNVASEFSIAFRVPTGVKHFKVRSHRYSYFLDLCTCLDHIARIFTLIVMQFSTDTLMFESFSGIFIPNLRR